jgi:dihydroorotase
VLFDLLITGGRVIDPGRGVDEQLDVAVSNGRIAALRSGIDPSETVRRVDARGRLVVPGLIDVHTHVFEHGTSIGIDPDMAGVRSGVTTVVDAGSCGCDTYEGFHNLVATRCQTRVLSMLHLARTGLASMPELRDDQDVDLDATVATVERHREDIVGIKVRAVGPAVRRMGVDLIKLARRAANETRTKVMVHIGDPLFRVKPTLTQDLLPLLEPGDIVTHLYTGAPGKVLDEHNHVLPELLEARDRGVVFDIAHGRYNFNFDVARRLMDQGVMPLTISTDITPGGRDDMLKSMTHTMNKFLALGCSLTDVVRMSTYHAAGLIGQQHELGTLAEGTTADITILEDVGGDWTYQDSQGQTIRGAKAVRPVLCFKDGVQFSVEYGPFPWGWLPNPQE